MNKWTDGWVPLSGGSEPPLQGLETCMPTAPRSHMSPTPMLPIPVHPQGHTPIRTCLYPCSRAPPPPLCTHSSAHIHFRAGFPRTVSNSFGRCYPLLSFLLREGCLDSLSKVPSPPCSALPHIPAWWPQGSDFILLNLPFLSL